MNEPAKPLVVLQSKSPMSLEMKERIQRAVEEMRFANFVIVDNSIEASVHHEIQPLADAIDVQAQAINALARSVSELIAVIAEEQAGEEAPPTTYLDGTPAN